MLGWLGLTPDEGNTVRFFLFLSDELSEYAYQAINIVLKHDPQIHIMLIFLT